MTTFTKIAWRNVTRNRARSFITISAITIGLASLIFLKGFVEGADRQMVENYTDLFIGQIQIHRAGFQKNMGLDKTIGNTDTITSAFKNIPQITAFAPRIKNYSLISSAESSSGILLLGIDPDAEKNISNLHKRLRQGKFLEKGDNNKIIIGKGLAENLKLELGDKAVIMGQASDGSVAAAAFEVAGILEAGAEEIDKGLALITLKAAQDLLVLDNKVSEIVVKSASLDSIDGITTALKEKIDQKKYEVFNWKEISPMIYQWLQFDEAFTTLILVIVLIVVASGILNTVLMGVFERIREFGVMLALGTKPRQIIVMVATESFLLGLFGVILGTLLGTGLIIFFASYGINLSVLSHALNSFYIGSIIYTRLNIISMAWYAAVVLLVSILISIFPAIKASRLEPIEAIRHI